MLCHDLSLFFREHSFRTDLHAAAAQVALAVVYLYLGEVPVASTNGGLPLGVLFSSTQLGRRVDQQSLVLSELDEWYEVVLDSQLLVTNRLVV